MQGVLLTDTQLCSKLFTPVRMMSTSCFFRRLCCCRYTLPLSELGGDFYDELKSISSGYASFDYEEADYRQPILPLLTGTKSAVHDTLA